MDDDDSRVNKKSFSRELVNKGNPLGLETLPLLIPVSEVKGCPSLFKLTNNTSNGCQQCIDLRLDSKGSLINRSPYNKEGDV